MQDATDGLTYPSAFAGTDLSYQVTQDAVKADLILNSASAAGSGTWTWRIKAPGMTLAKTDAGAITFTGAAGLEPFYIPTPVVSDSSGVTGVSDPAMVPLTTSLSKTADGVWTLTLSADPTWLNDPARVYPVVVDPDVNYGATTIYDYQRVGSTTTTYQFGVTRVGNSRSGGDSYWRTVACYPYGNLIGQQLTGAEGILSNAIGGASTTYSGGWFSAFAFSFDGANVPALSNFPTTVPSTGNHGTGYAPDQPLFNFLNAQIQAGMGGVCWLLDGQESAGAYTYRQGDSSLYMTYQALPTVAAIQVATNTGTTTSPTGGSAGPVAPTFAISSTDPSGQGLNYRYEVSTNSNPDTSPAWSTGWTSSTVASVPMGTLQPSTVYYWKAYAQNAYGSVVATPTYSWTTTSLPIIPTGSVAPAPANKSIVASLTPQFVAPTATVTNGQTLTYSIRVTTGADGISGQIIQSPPLTPSGGQVTWTPPAGVLQDGASYTWVEVINDVYDNWSPAPNRLTVSMRVSNPGPAPVDAAGPVSVNMANGNVSASFSTPTVTTVGGPMGFSFNYNSQLAGNAGLTGSYYNITPPSGQSAVYSFTGQTPVLTRTDPTIGFSWNGASPGPSVPGNYFLAQWSGYITPPAGTYQFGFQSDDGARLYLNQPSVTEATTPTINQWSTNSNFAPVWGNAAAQQLVVTASGSTLTATLGGAPVPLPLPITVQYEQATGPATMNLMVENVPDTSPTSSQIMPASWFTRTPQSLPSGWAGSGAIAGDSQKFISADSHEGYVILTDTSGGTHTFTKLSSGGYSPPPGEAGTLSTDFSGVLTFTDDAGTVYLFNAAGQVTSVTTPADLTKPAAPVSTYVTSSALSNALRSISDPLSLSGSTYSRQVVFAYGTDSASSVGLPGSGLACPAVPNFTAAPPGMICAIVYPSDASDTNRPQQSTQLLYDQNGQLARIVNPGGAQTDFGYTQVNGLYLLSVIRNPFENDWIAAGAHGTPTAFMETTIGYNPSTSKALTVTLPSPTGLNDSPQPAKTYTYSSQPTTTADGTTYVDEAGLTGHAGTVTFNSSLRQTSAVSPSGLTTTTTWNNHDNPLTTIAPGSIETANVYDTEDRLTDTYGPAPASCFAGTALPTSCPTAAAAHTHTSYDGGLAGLNTSYFANVNATGAPTALALGIGTADGSVNQTWSGAPAAGIPATYWSAVLNGTITFPATAGTYAFSLQADDIAQLYINNQLIATQGGAGSYTATAGEVDPIRITYAQATGPSFLKLYWTPPSGTNAIVPGSVLSPDYSLATSSTVDESVPTGLGLSSTQVTGTTVTNTYGASPWLGQTASSAVAIGGTSLTSTATYETSATLYNRQLTSSKPAGTTTSNSFYGPTESYGSGLGLSVAVCGLPLSTPQFGLLKQSTGPTNSASVASVTRYIYDLFGRVVAEQTTGDTGWTCVTYDSRNRVSQTTIPDAAYGGTRTITHLYTSDGTSTGNPLVTSIQDNGATGSTTSGKIITTTDLLGRTTQYNDVWNTVTVNTYNALNQLTNQTSTPAGGAAKGEIFSYNSDGQISTVTKTGAPNTTLATMGYTNGKLTSVNFPYGAGASGSNVSGAIGYGPTGAESSVAWTFPSSQNAVTDNVIRSQAGKILQDAIADGSTQYVSNYTYDAADRLVLASIPHHTLSYSYASSGGCGADTAAGANGNRTSFSDQKDAGTPMTTSYCYDNADRLTSTTVTNPISGADPVQGTSLTSSTLQYDAHGNVTILADQTMTYDASNRHLTTSTPSATSTVTYVRDATDRIIAMTTLTNGASTTVRYSFTGPGDGVDWTLSSTNTVLEHTLTLPGGVVVSIQSGGGSWFWTFSDIHGDAIVTTGGGGSRLGSLAQYDPFGNPIDPSSHNIGTNTADDAVLANTATPTATFGWEGAAQKLDQHVGDVSTVEMGARQYVPGLGRFLSVDPITGGNANSYNYPNDPVNLSDISGFKGGTAGAHSMNAHSCDNDCISLLADTFGLGSDVVQIGTNVFMCLKEGDCGGDPEVWASFPGDAWNVATESAELPLRNQPVINLGIAGNPTVIKYANGTSMELGRGSKRSVSGVSLGGNFARVATEPVVRRLINGALNRRVV